MGLKADERRRKNDPETATGKKAHWTDLVAEWGTADADGRMDSPQGGAETQDTRLAEIRARHDACGGIRRDDAEYLLALAESSLSREDHALIGKIQTLLSQMDASLHPHIGAIADYVGQLAALRGAR